MEKEYSIDLDTINNLEDLEGVLSNPSKEVTAEISGLPGDIVVLGAGGKMGPTLAMMLKKAASRKTVYAVSRFSDPAVRDRLEKADIKTVAIDLLDETCYHQLPEVENVYFLAGMKFGATGKQPLTWAMNAFVPGLAARHYRHSRMVVFSTGNVYPFADNSTNGCKEDATPAPIGEYAQSCLGRERMFQYFSEGNDTPMALVRLNYANEPRYGIIVDLALKIMRGEPIDLTTGVVNLIWQRDANDYIARAISIADSPPAIINVAGPEKIMVRELVEKIAQMLNKKTKFINDQGPTSLLSDASYCFKKFGYPKTSLDEMVTLIVKWVSSGKELLNKPTKYEVRDGKF